MKKYRQWLPLLFAITLIGAGCGSKTSESNHKKAETISTTDGKVILNNYKGLKATQKVYKVTKEHIQGAIDDMLYEYVTYQEVSRASKENDVLYADLTVTSGKEILLKDGNYELLVGNEEFGADFDKKITGVKKGKQLSFTLTYPEDSEVVLTESTSLAGQTVTYDLKIKKITEEVLPELNEKFIQEELGFDSKDAMTAYVETALREQYEIQSLTEVREALLQQVIDGSKVTRYSDALYDEAISATEEGYMETAKMFDFESVDSLLEAWEISKDTLKEEALQLVYRTVVVQALCDKEHITLTDEEYQTGIESYVEELGLESLDELLEAYEEDTLRIWLKEDKVMDILYENATITEVEADIDDVEE